MKKLFLSTLILAGLSFTACNNSNSADVREETAEAVDEMQESFETEKAELRASMEEMGRDIDNKIAEIDAKMEEAGDDMKAELEQQKAKLQAAKNDLDREMEELGNEIADNWEQFKQDFNNWKEETFDEL
ncbi:MAG: hypothetical protein KDC49_15345 [Saprospiraceae bacterium]|nr:hypothetical protein [Saprospiraceae bacterium]